MLDYTINSNNRYKHSEISSLLLQYTEKEIVKEIYEYLPKTHLHIIKEININLLSKRKSNEYNSELNVVNSLLIQSKEDLKIHEVEIKLLTDCTIAEMNLQKRFLQYTEHVKWKLNEYTQPLNGIIKKYMEYFDIELYITNEFPSWWFDKCTLQIIFKERIYKNKVIKN